MRLSVILLSLLITNALFASSYELDAATKERIKQSAISFFESDEIIELTVKADFTSIRADRDRTTNEYHPATVVLVDDGDELQIPVKIKTRGNFRLKTENCDFPPLRFKFKTRNVINTAFEGQKKLKLVTHCRDTSETMQNTMLREYLVYKMYNTVSDKSLRVRLVKVKYEDTVYGEELIKYAFFVESVDQMAERLGLEEV
ncbi:MAG: CotH kinase family protein, partial [Bacteroidales bacterium]|nr:CotH kinase family protein [Bacteroidales bacterium]